MRSANSDSPGRAWVVPLALTIMVAFGVILYGFSVYATDQAAGGEFSKTVLSLAYGGSVFSGGLFAFTVGRLADKHGVRAILAVGAVLGCLGLVGFSVANQPWQVVAAWWLLLGPAQAMVYYEPAYVAIDQWAFSVEHRARILATITVIGGLAGIIFIPLITRLVEVLGWRPTVAVMGLLLLIVGGGTSLFGLPRRQNDEANIARAATSRTIVTGLLQDRHFLLYTVALTLILLSTQGVIAHRIANFEETGFSLATVSLWAAVASAMSLPGRWIAPRLAEQFGATKVQSIIAVVVAASVALMINGATSWQMIGHFCLFGLAFGALLPLRSLVMGGWYSGQSYGRVMGAQWTAVVLTAAAGPVVVGVLRDTTGSYTAPFALLTVLFVAAAVLISASNQQ